MVCGASEPRACDVRGTTAAVMAPSSSLSESLLLSLLSLSLLSLLLLESESESEPDDVDPRPVGRAGSAAVPPPPAAELAGRTALPLVPASLLVVAAPTASLRGLPLPPLARREPGWFGRGC